MRGGALGPGRESSAQVGPGRERSRAFCFLRCQLQITSWCASSTPKLSNEPRKVSGFASRRERESWYLPFANISLSCSHSSGEISRFLKTTVSRKLVVMTCSLACRAIVEVRRGARSGRGVSMSTSMVLR